MPDKPTLLYVINHIDWFWSHRLPLAQGAQQAGYDVSVTVPQASRDTQLAQAGFNGIDLDGGLLQSIVKLRRIIAQQKPDIIHAITIKYAFITGLAALGLPRVKLVHTIAGLGYLFSGDSVKARILRVLIAPFLKLALRGRNTHLIFQNPDDMQIMMKGGFAVAERAHLIPGSGVDIEQFMPRDNIPEATPPIVLMPTRLLHDKGVGVFVQAARLLKNRGVDVNMQIAGGVSSSNPLAISEVEMQTMVADGVATWLGRVDDMPDLLARASIVAYPSHYREGIPKVLLEACACAKPIITTDHPGCREAVRDNDNGLLVPIKDPKALADAIETLLKDKDARQQMGARSRQRATEEFSANLITEQTIAVYHVCDRTKN